MNKTKTREEKEKSNSWVLPGQSLDEDQFMEGIRQAEEGPFNTVEKSMEHFEQWMKQREKR